MLWISNEDFIFGIQPLHFNFTRGAARRGKTTCANDPLNGDRAGVSVYNENGKHNTQLWARPVNTQSQPAARRQGSTTRCPVLVITAKPGTHRAAKPGTHRAADQNVWGPPPRGGGGGGGPPAGGGGGGSSELQGGVDGGGVPVGRYNHHHCWSPFLLMSTGSGTRERGGQAWERGRGRARARASLGESEGAWERK